MNPRHVLSLTAALMVLSGGGPVGVVLWLVVTGWMVIRIV